MHTSECTCEVGSFCSPQQDFYADLSVVTSDGKEVRIHRAVLAAHLTDRRVLSDVTHEFHWCGHSSATLHKRLRQIYRNELVAPAASSAPKVPKCTHAIRAGVPVIADTVMATLLQPLSPRTSWPDPDCVVVSGVASWHCHRAVLAARCEYFFAAFLPRWSQVHILLAFKTENNILGGSAVCFTSGRSSSQCCRSNTGSPIYRPQSSSEHNGYCQRIFIAW